MPAKSFLWCFKGKFVLISEWQWSTAHPIPSLICHWRRSESRGVESTLLTSSRLLSPASGAAQSALSEEGWPRNNPWQSQSNFIRCVRVKRWNIFCYIYLAVEIFCLECWIIWRLCDSPKWLWSRNLGAPWCRAALLSSHLASSGRVGPRHPHSVKRWDNSPGPGSSLARHSAISICDWQLWPPCDLWLCRTDSGSLSQPGCWQHSCALPARCSQLARYLRKASSTQQLVSSVAVSRLTTAGKMKINIWTTVCPRNSDPLYIVSFYIKWGTTS